MKITHVMADGTVRESIEGLVIPISNQETYRILAEHETNKKRKEKSDEKEIA